MDQENIVSAIRKIGIPGNRNFVPYYTSNSWNGEHDSFYFFSVEPGSFKPALYLYDVTEDSFKKCFDLNFCKNDTDVKRLIFTVFLIRRGLMICFCDNQLIEVDLKTGEQNVKFSFGKELLFDGCCVSEDERYYCFGTTANAEKTPTKVQIIDTTLPEWKEICTRTIDMHANHFQFFRNGKDILFAHEGVTTGIPDRLNLLNWETGEIRCLHWHIHDENGKQIECIGHEHIAGDKVVAVRYPDSQMEKIGIILVDPATGDFELVSEGDYWHSASNQAGTRFVMDSTWWANSKRKIPDLIDIVLFDNVKKKKHVLNTFEANPLGEQMYHSHPHTNPEGSRVLYSVRPKGETQACHLELVLLKDF